MLYKRERHIMYARLVSSGMEGSPQNTMRQFSESYKFYDSLHTICLYQLLQHCAGFRGTSIQIFRIATYDTFVPVSTADIQSHGGRFFLDDNCNPNRPPVVTTVDVLWRFLRACIQLTRYGYQSTGFILLLIEVVDGRRVWCNSRAPKPCKNWGGGTSLLAHHGGFPPK